MTHQQSSSKSGKINPKAWLVVLAVFVVGIGMAWAQNKCMPIMGLLQTDLGISAGIAGWISGVFSLMGIVLAFPAVGIIRKWGALKGGLVSVAVTLVGSVVGLFAPNEYVLLVSRIIEGFGIGIISVLAPAVIAMWFPIEKRGLPMGIWSSWQQVAVAGVFLLADTILGPAQTWSHMWIVGIVVLIVGGLLFATFVRTPKNEENYADSTDTSVKVTEVFKHKSVYIMCIGGVGFGLACMTFCNWAPSFWVDQAGMDLGLANGIVGWMYLAEVFCCILGGFILNHVKNRQRFAAASAFAYAVVFYLLFVATDFPIVIVLCVLYCIIEGLFCSSMWTLIAQTTPDPRLSGAAMAFFAMATNLGMMLGAPLSGMILDATAMTGWGYVAIFAGVCQLIAGITFLAMKLYDEQGNEIKR